jgi:tetratricopeptide (TPR) repeat protein
MKFNKQHRSPFSIEGRTMIQRGRIVLPLVSVVLLVATASFSQSGHPSSGEGLSPEEEYKTCFHKADYDIGKFQFDDCIKQCEEALKYEPNDYLVRAMMCLSYYEIAEKLDIHNDADKKRKIELYNKMLAVAQEGIKCAPEKGECYFMRGLANARIATTKGIFSELFTAKGIENDWLVAVNRKSDYTTPNGENLQASSCIALGVYYRLCPSFFLLRWMFGISGDLDKAVYYCKKAYDLDSTRIEIVKEYGVALITRGLDQKNNEDIEQGKAYLKEVPILPLRLDTDSVDIAHSKMLLNDISLCPGYSRDEEQDISEQSYEKQNK